MVKIVFFWPVKLELSDGLAVLDSHGTLYSLSLGRWATLVDQTKRDFRARRNIQISPGTGRNSTPAIEKTLKQIETVLSDPESNELKDIHVCFLGTELQKQVWTYLMENVQYGETTTYSKIALDLNVKNARVVANCCAANKIAVVVPCHRVLTSAGKNTGYRWGIKLKEKLLAMESGREK